ncbi:hypothetical protein HO133_000328 [Letharia lupina]|uniref:Uncharacterized protein n=1 Tax=Letharia lupina TaxID=560253 RepID=A0A8H6CH56_9LECA|nr:uncharacterized protein HO133_000328 [Letharia lupina]KAF6223485.1 hypothetical protein HO133_000328 [Letharia lupina]
MATYASNDTFHPKTADFLKWLRERPGTTISRKLEIIDLRDHNAGRGIGNRLSPESLVSILAESPVVAVEDVEEDEELFRIAQSDVLTVQNSSLQKVKPHLLERLDPWNSLVLVMIYEDGLGKESKWWNYLQLLPTNFDTLIYWSLSELAELEGSAVLNKIKKMTLTSLSKSFYCQSCNSSLRFLVGMPMTLLVPTHPPFYSTLLTEWPP